MTLKTLLAALATRLKNPGLALNAAGVCRLVIDGKVGLTIEQVEGGEGAVLYSVIGHAPDSGREAFFARLLQAQLYNQEIGEGCSFGFDPATNEIVLNRKMSLPKQDADSFYAALNEFVNWTDHWTEAISSSGSAAQPAAPPAFNKEHAAPHFLRA